MRNLAQKLLAVEAASPSESHSHILDGLRVYEKLRISLTRFAGADGFTALMRRALSLARVEQPLLQSVTVRDDGSLAGLPEALADSGDVGVEATIVLTTHLLALLVIFIGKPLTLRLVSNAWPDGRLDK